jgi:hypothetical protein
MNDTNVNYGTSAAIGGSGTVASGSGQPQTANTHSKTSKQ